MIKEGVFLGKRYEILGRIGSGGMADVYKGKDHKLNRYVAIKVLKSDYRSDEVFIKKFLSEAQAAAGLMHPNVVNVYDVGQDRGLYYMVMELVEGITLKDYIEKKGKLSAKETVSISIQMVTGLQAAHNQHIIHRDIKPQNIIISKDGKVKVTDFGIARATTSTQTISTSVMGSVHYTSPEQARGGIVDQKSDIYSIGITMYEMVTGHVPFDGDSTVTVALKHLQEDMVSPAEEVPDIPYSLECIIMKCTQKNAERRYHDCESLLLDLKRSLVDPDGDFVGRGSAAGAVTETDRTVVMSTAELNQVQRQYKQDDDYEDDYEDDDYEDEDEDDDRPSSRNRSRSSRRRNQVNKDTQKVMRILMIVAGVVIALLVIFLVANAFGAFRGSGLATVQEETVKIPDILGMTEEEAKAELKKYELGINVTDRKPSSQYAEGEVMALEKYETGESVPKHTTIEVVLSTGEEAKTTEVPAVVGKSESEAEKLLGDANLIAKKDYQNSDEYENSIVMSCSPAPGAEVEEGTEITLVVSLGKKPEEKVSVPTLTGKTASQAESALADAGLVGSASEEYSDSVEAGKVISQSIDAGEKVKKGTTVSYVVSKGAKTKVVTVPSNLINTEQSAAEKLITEAGLVPEYVEEEYSDTVPSGCVTRVQPGEGANVEKGSTVKYWISIGPKSGGSDSGDQGGNNSGGSDEE